MKLLKRLAILITICLVAVYGFIQSGIFNVAATNKDGPLITWLLQKTMEKSVERRAQDIEVPDIKNNEMILAGLSDYVEMCAQCHGEPDKPSSILTQGLNPAPPDLEHLTEEGSAAEMFWVINNGIRMTGMPAFGKTHQVDEIWPVVAFLLSAKDITSSEYNRMKKKPRLMDIIKQCQVWRIKETVSIMPKEPIMITMTTKSIHSQLTQLMTKYRKRHQRIRRLKAMDTNIAIKIIA